MARALVRPITRKQALSYSRTYPNGSGVTALAEVNGRGAYARRYKQAERILRSAKRARAKARHGGVMRRRKLRGAAKKAFLARMRRGRRAAGYRANMGYTKAYASGWDSVFGKKKRKKKSSGPRAGRTKRERGIGTLRTPVNPFATAKKPRRKKKSTASKQVAARTAARKKTAKSPKRPRYTRVYAKGRYRTVTARIGSKRRRTYAYVTKKGNVRKVPMYARLGFTSALAMRRALAKGGKRADRAKARMSRWETARARAAERAAKRILAGRDLYVANKRRKRRRTVTFEEWQMRANKRRKRKSAPKRRRRATSRRRRPTVRRKRRTTRRRYRANARKKSGGKKRGGKRGKRRKPLTPGQRLYIARRMRKRVAKKLRQTAKWVRRGRHSRRQMSRTLYNFADAVSATKFNNNRRRRRYRRNFAGAFVQNLKDVLKFGGTALVGYGSHRALTKLFDDNVAARIGFLNGPTIGPYRQLISGLFTAAAGILGVAKFAPAKYAQTIGGGMGLSFLQQLLLTVLGKLGSTGAQVAPYLSAYPDDGSAAYNGFGSYYTFGPRTVYPSQLRAGVGSMPLLQAAAGIGEYEVVPGMGEYLESANTGLIQGSAGFGAVDEGIAPNLHSAEQALNVAEAAAGMGDLSLVSTVDPMMQAVAVPDEPGGSRSGVLAGQDGVFG